MVFDREENILGKGENAGYQHFLVFPKCSERLQSSGVVESGSSLVKEYPVLR